MSIINLCLWLYILLKPFYLFGSGNVQPSDLLIVVAFVCTIMTNKRTKIINKHTIYVIIFFIFVLMINLIYYLQFNNYDFIHSTFYYFFILLGIMVFNTKVQDKKFLEKCYYIFIINVIVQGLIYIAGIGKYWMGTYRYMGTLTDPNQFAFFIFLCLMFLYILENILIKKRKVLIYILGIVLIFFSSSTGMLLAVAMFLIANLLMNKNYIHKFIRFLTSKKNLCILLIITLLFSYEVVIKDNWDNIVSFINDNIVNSHIIKRTMEKFDKTAESTDNLTQDRNLNILFDNMEYSVFGAGEGYYMRFDRLGEIHSTLPSILFCYGIIPTLILSYWVFKNLKGIGIRNLVPYLAIFIESFTLVNHRQLLLWVLIMVAVNLKKETISKNEENVIDGKKKKLLLNNYTSL